MKMISNNFMKEISRYSNGGWSEEDKSVFDLCKTLSQNLNFFESSVECSHARETLASFAHRIKENFPSNAEAVELANNIHYYINAIFFSFSDPLRQIFSGLVSDTYGCYSQMETLRLVSKAFNRDGSYIRHQFAQKYFSSFRMFGLGSPDKVVEYINIHNFKKINLKGFLVTKSHLEKLVSQNILSLQIDCRGINEWPKMESIRYLKPYNFYLNDVIKFTEVFPNLESIDLSEGTLGDEGLVELAKFPTLKIVDLYRAHITDVGLSPFTQNSPNLETINLSRTKVTDVGISALLAACTKLKSLDLSNTEITGEGLANLGVVLQELTTINLTYNIHLTDMGLAAFAKVCPNLKSINLEGTKITGAGLTQLSKYCQELTSINLSCSQISNIEKIHFWPKLKIANFYLTKLNDSGLIELAKACSNLDVLKLTCTDISDIGLAELAKNTPSLTTIYLNKTQVTAFGLELIAKACNKLSRIVSQLPEKHITLLRINYPNIEFDNIQNN